MATDIGANIVQEDLIFGFDSSYGVADNTTATRFYPGEPTTNLITSDGLDFTVLGSYTNLNRAQVVDSNSPSGYACEMEVADGSAINSAARVTFGQNTNMPSSGNATVSVYAKFESGASSNIIPKIYNGSGTAWQSLSPLDGGSAYLTSEYRRFAYYGAIRANPGFSMVQGNTSIQTGQKTRWYSPQVELKGHATPFVNGTRSSTAGLIDLKRTNDINITNVSFTSTGQPTLDGTDDKFDINFPTLSSDFGSIEVVVARKDTTTNSFIFGAVGGSTNRYYLRHAGSTSYDACRGNPLANASFGVMTQDKLYHLVMTWDLNTVYAYTNGVLSASSSYTNPGTDITSGNVGRGSGNYVMADLPVLKVYGKTLSATEIKQNYNAYKKRFDL